MNVDGPSQLPPAKREVIPPETLAQVRGNIVRTDPAEAGRRGAAAKERNALAKLAETRDYLNAQSATAAQHVVGVITGDAEPNPTRLAAARDVLDRTVGKAATEVRIGPAEQTLDILRELDA